MFPMKSCSTWRTSVAMRGLGIIAQAGREDLMFQFMIALERQFPQRQVPTRLFAEGGEEIDGFKDGKSEAVETSKI